MGTSRSESKQSGQPSERDQFWLDHEAALVASGKTAKEYAAAKGVSLQGNRSTSGVLAFDSVDQR